MRYLFQAIPSLQITRDSRGMEEGDFRIRAQGANPIPTNISNINIPGGRCNLQVVVCM